MKPGDVIEWVHKRSGDLVVGDENLWSTTERRFVPIGGEMIHFLVSINDETLSWLNEKGLFHARVDDSMSRSLDDRTSRVVPRTRAK